MAILALVPKRALTLLATCAGLSGFAALALELLWGRELALTFGGSQYAVAAVLTAFMLGLGVGSRVAGGIADRARSPAQLAAAVELALVVIGPLWSIGLLRLPSAAATVLPAADDAASAPFLLGRLAIGVAVLVVPTALMGAGFPLLARAVASSVQDLHHAIGRLVAAATFGGVAGAVATGLLILPSAGIPGAAACAAAASAGAALAALAAQRSLARAPAARPQEVVSRRPFDRQTAALLLAAALSGGLVLGAETIWHRALLMVMANSTATLTLLLAVTLAGLALGAAAAAPLLRRGRHLELWTGLQAAAAILLVTQAALLPSIAVAARAIRPDTGWGRVLVPPIVVGGCLIVPVAVILGAAWPLLLAAATPRIADGGRRIGTMAIVNSVGAAGGAATAGFLLLPALGFGRSLLLLAACHAALAASLSGERARWPRRLAAGAAAVLAGTAALAPSFSAVPLPSTVGSPETTVLAYRESPAGTVVVTENPNTGARSMYVDNNAAIGASYPALKVVRMLGLVPALLHPRPERVLVIGYGAGVTTATIAAAPGVDRVEVAEIVPAVVDAAKFFEPLNHGITDDPRVTVTINDGRNHLLLRETSYDVITCDPVHPLYGSAPLYSLDYFSLCRRRLRPGGVVCQYLPLHRMPTADFRRAIATFDAAFPETWVLFGLGHAMLIGGDRPLDLDWERWQRVLENHRLRSDLAESALATPAQIAALFQLDPEGCRRTGSGPLSTDLHPRLEFLAPEAYRPGLWEANARVLVDGYRSPLDRIRSLPPSLVEDLRRLVAGKRLLLFSLLARDAGNAAESKRWLGLAIQVAGDDPEVQMYAAAFGGS